MDLNFYEGVPGEILKGHDPILRGVLAKAMLVRLSLNLLLVYLKMILAQVKRVIYAKIYSCGLSKTIHSLTKDTKRRHQYEELGSHFASQIEPDKR